jgi:hypothetical protein
MTLLITQFSPFCSNFQLDTDIFHSTQFLNTLNSWTVTTVEYDEDKELPF